MKNTRRKLTKKNRTRRNRRSGGSKERKKTVVIGKVFADWCGHCISIKQDWEKMKTMVKNNMGRSLKNTKFIFAELGDTEQNRNQNITVDKLLQDLNSQYFPNDEQKVESNGFPTLFRICGKKIEYYTDSDRSAKGLYVWYTRKCT